MHGRTRKKAALALVAAGLLAQPAMAAIYLPTADIAIGQWDMALSDGSKQCRMTLRKEETGTGHLVGMPAGCRRSMPVLSHVGIWSLAGTNGVKLADFSGQPVLDFSSKGDNLLIASGPQGESYTLAAVDGVARGIVVAQAPKPAPAAPASTKPQAAAVPATPALPVPKISEMGGRYAVLREKGRDTGCMLTLDDRNRTRGGLKATLAPACRDQGIVIFDPTGWEMKNGRLTLTAKKGHTTHLDHQADGTWERDTQDGGKPLGLKKL